MPSVKELVTEYARAAGEKRYEDLPQLVAEDATFSGTVKNETRGRDSFVDGFRNLGPVTVRHDIRQIVVDGNNAAVLYDLVTNTQVGNVQCAEFVTTDGTLIRSSVLIFDWRRWPEVLQEMRARVTSAA